MKTPPAFDFVSPRTPAMWDKIAIDGVTLISLKHPVWQGLERTAISRAEFLRRRQQCTVMRQAAPAKTGTNPICRYCTDGTAAAHWVTLPHRDALPLCDFHRHHLEFRDAQCVPILPVPKGGDDDETSPTNRPWFGRVWYGQCHLYVQRQGRKIGRFLFSHLAAPAVKTNKK